MASCLAVAAYACGVAGIAGLTFAVTDTVELACP